MTDSRAEDVARRLAGFLEDVDPTGFQEEARDVYMTMAEYREVVLEDVHRAVREHGHSLWAAQYMDGVMQYLRCYAEDSDEDDARTAAGLISELCGMGIEAKKVME